MKKKNIMSDVALHKSVEFMLLNVYSLPNVGFVYGKAGIVLTLFELSKYTGKESYEEYGYELLREILTYNLENKNFAYGTAGIGYVLHYLIKNQFLDADYCDIYGEKHQHVLDEIKTKLESSSYDKYHYADFLFFVETLSVYIPLEEREKCEYILILGILNALLIFESKKELSPAEISDFYQYASKLLSICNSCHILKKHCNRFLVKIKNINESLTNKDVICEEPLFGFQLYVYGKLRQENDLAEMGEKIICKTMANLYSFTLNFRQKIDVAYIIFRVYNLDQRLDYREFAKSLMTSFNGNKIDIFEKNIAQFVCTNSIPKIDCGNGLCRLLLLNVFWHEMEQGVCSDNMIELLN